jgi:ABC-type transporter Mla subunit MlaD
LVVGIAAGIGVLAPSRAARMSAGGSNGEYTVRAIFDDAGNLISGEVVKIDGVKVGTVGTVTPTPQAKAADRPEDRKPRVPRTSAPTRPAPSARRR